MKTAIRMCGGIGRTALVALAAMLAIACSVDKQTAPALTGPSEFGLSLTLIASPDQLPRDGSSQSLVMITVRDASGAPVSGQRLALSTSAGALSASEVTTSSNGTATVQFIAPPLSTDVTDA